MCGDSSWFSLVADANGLANKLKPFKLQPVTKVARPVDVPGRPVEILLSMPVTKVAVISSLPKEAAAILADAMDLVMAASSLWPACLALPTEVANMVTSICMYVCISVCL